MIRGHRSSVLGRYVAVCLVAVLAVAIPARPLVAAPEAPVTKAFPTRLEGQVKSISGDSWLVDQTPVALGPYTTLNEKRGVAEVGAWVLVVGLQYSDLLQADTIEVLRAAGTAMPTYQITGILRKQAAAAWVIGETAVEITEDTNRVSDLVVGSLVRAVVRRVSSGFEALEIREIARNSDSIPYAIRGTVEQVTDNSLVVDGSTILISKPQIGAPNQGDTIEVAAVLDERGELVAQEMQIIDPTRDALLDGYVKAVDGLGEDDQTWTLVVFNENGAEERTIRVTPNTYVDEGRAVIGTQVEAQVKGIAIDAGSIDAAQIQLERPIPGMAAGALMITGSEAIWHVGNQPVWFGSDQLRQEAEAIAGRIGATTGPLAAAQASADVIVRGVRLRNGILIARQLFSREAAAAEGLFSGADAGATDAEAANLKADDWHGPTDINASLVTAANPAILFDANGGGHAVYESLGKIYYAYAPPQAPWGPPRKIGTGSKPAAVFDATGQLHVVYTSEFMGNYDILHVRLTPAGWSLPHIVAATSGKSDDPAIAADTNGKVYVGWADNTSGEWAIQIGMWDGRYWTSYPVTNARGQNPALVVMPDNGALFLAWQDRIPLGLNSWGNYDIFVSERANTDRHWSLPVNISDNRTFRTGSDSLGARVAAANEPYAHVAWIEDAARVRYNWGRDLYWPTPVDVTARQPLARGLSMQMAAEGFLYLAWDEGTSLRVTASPPRTNKWPAAIALATRSAPASGPVFDVSLAPGGDGGMAVSWVQDSLSGSMGIYESRYNMPSILLWYYLPIFVAY